MFDWEDLRFFLAVARAGSFSAAAQVLKVSQPTVGRRIAGLERALGARLFVANARGQITSATGKRMLEHAERMELEATAAARVAYGRDAGLRGRISVTASEWLVNSAIAPALNAFFARYPALELELMAEPSHLSLARRQADIAIRPSRSSERDVVHREIAQLSFGLYASDAYLAARGAPDFSRGCTGHALIAMSEELSKVPDVDWLPRIAPRARVVVRANGREPMVGLAVSGVGLVCLPRFLGDRAPSLRLLPAPPPVPTRNLWICVHRDTRGLPRAKAAVGFLTGLFERLRPVLAPASS